MATPRRERNEAGDDQALRAADFRTLAEHIPDVVARFDRQLRHVYVNRAIERLTGIPRAAFLGRTAREVGFPDRVAEVWEDHLRRAFETGTAERAEFTYTGPAGPRYLESRIVPEAAPRGRIESAVAITRDMTEWRWLEQSQRFLVHATTVLASSLDYEETLTRVAELAVPEIADWCVVYLARGDRLETVALEHADPAKVALARRLQERYPPRPDAAIGVYEVFRTGRAEVWPEIPEEALEATAVDDEHLRILHSLGLRSAMLVPLIARGGTLGVLALIATESERRFEESDTGFVQTLADRAALAVDNAGLFREAKAAEERADFLAHAGAVLTASLDYETTLRALARLAVPRVADWCMVDVLEPGDGDEVRRVATEHVDPTKMDALRELRRRYPPYIGSPQPAAHALRRGELLFYAHVSDEELARLTRDAGHARLVRSLGLHSLIAVPLIARGETLGALTLVTTGPDRTYGLDDRIVAEDLARRAATAIDNARLYERALVASRAKSDFLTVMSHELRTPLNAAMGYADLLDAGIAGPITGAQKRHVDRLRVSIRQLLDLVERILEFSRVAAGAEAVRTERFDLARLIGEVVDVVRPRALEKGLAVEVDVPASPWSVETDPDKVRTILVSLVSNAEKFTDEGGIGVDARREDDDVIIDVYDTGIGIEADARERIFEPFTQAVSPTTRRVGGVGLGLTVARRMARRLGGDITVASEPGRGTTFTVRLPVRWPEER